MKLKEVTIGGGKLIAISQVTNGAGVGNDHFALLMPAEMERQEVLMLSFISVSLAAGHEPVLSKDLCSLLVQVR